MGLRSPFEDVYDGAEVPQRCRREEGRCIPGSQSYGGSPSRLLGHTPLKCIELDLDLDEEKISSYSMAVLAGGYNPKSRGVRTT